MSYYYLQFYAGFGGSAHYLIQYPSGNYSLACPYLEDCNPLPLTLDEAQQFRDTLLSTNFPKKWTINIEEADPRKEHVLSISEAKSIGDCLEEFSSR